MAFAICVGSAALPLGNALAGPSAGPELAVCVDPANLPYSSDEQPGYENKIADVLAADLHASVRYDWYRPYRNFLKATLLAGRCDVVISVPASLPGLSMTLPYFNSSYVAVMRANDTRHFTSFNDAWLRDARIGVQLVGEDRSETPPSAALTSRNITGHITGFVMRSTREGEYPQGRIVDAVADGTIDVAFVWGPIAGYFARAHGNALRLKNITADPKNPDLTFTYPIAMGVRGTDRDLRDRLQTAIDHHESEIAAILRNYGIPTVPMAGSSDHLPAQSVAQRTTSSVPAQSSGGN